MWQMSAQAKSFVDRMHPRYNMMEQKGAIREIDLILAVTQGSPDVNENRAYIELTQRMFTRLGFNPVYTIVAANTENKDDIKKNTTIIEEAGSIISGI